MTALLVWFKRVSLLALAVLLVGCSTLAPQPVQSTNQPTPDLNVVRTEAAATVVAQITVDAALNPTATLVQPTATAVPVDPTATIVPTLVPSVTPLPTLTKAPVSGGGGGSLPTRTPTYYTDAAVLVTQKPADYSVFAPNTEFDITWTVKNTGFREWNDDFYFNYISGPESSTGQTNLFTGAVSKGGTASVTVDIIAPSEPGNYVVRWGLINDDGVTFYSVNCIFTVR